MPLRFPTQLIRMSAIVTPMVLGISPIVQAAPTPPGPSLSACDEGDDWPEDFSRLLDSLTALMCVVRSSDDALSLKVEAVSALYHAGGIPSAVNRLEGLILVAAAYKVLKTDPGYLSVDLAKTFAEDLRNMYRDLGGVPSLLG
jgi:hypothetical protein